MNNIKCESCGMPMNNINDFGGKDPSNKYCIHCTDTHGKLKTFQDKVDDFKRMLIQSNDFGESQAISLAKESLKQFPAWKDIKL